MAKTHSRRKRQNITGTEEDSNIINVSEGQTETVSFSPLMKKSQNEEGGNVKSKTDPACEYRSSKKKKLISDGFCLYIGNLNSSKTSQEIKDSLVNFFMTQSLQFQDVRLDRSRKHAFVDLGSEMDLTKALTLNGEMIHDQQLKIARAKVKNTDKKKVKDPQMDKKVKDGRCLFLKNLPYNATKEDILKVFCKAVAVRFPGGAPSPNTGIAFVEFRNKSTAKNMLLKKRNAKLQGRDLIVSNVRERSADAAAPPSNILFVRNLPKNVNEKQLQKVFKKAVQINIHQHKGKPKRFAFVKFESAADAEKVLQSSKNIKFSKQAAVLEMCRKRRKSDNTEVSLKTLFLAGLASKTTAETLKGAFEGSISARVIHKDTKRFGFVEFESEESCKAAKDAFQDCKIDGNEVTVEYASRKGERGQRDAGVDQGAPPVPDLQVQDPAEDKEKTGVLQFTAKRKDRNPE